MATEQAHSGQTGLRLGLGGARADFVGGLGRKVSDLRQAAARVRNAPDDRRTREELRRKLHALASASRLMKFDAMDRAIVGALGTIDRSDVDVPLAEVDLTSIEQVLEDLPALAWGDGDGRGSPISSVVKVPAPKYAALVVGSAHIAEALLEEPGAAFDPHGLPAITFVCETTPDPRAGFDIARSTEPDIIILDADLDGAIELVEALTDDPLTEGAPLVVIGSFEQPGGASRYVAMGVAKTLSKPTSKSTLRYECSEALSTRAASLPRFGKMGTPTASNGGLADVAFGERAPARLRGPASEVRLQGRRVIVADDDPAVVWFLADLLKTHGCSVYEAFDGKEAVETAYRTSPDLVLCDIMMPKVDGFMLCRTLRRDVALHDVPVILLSWKEDLLQRTRELGAGAVGYLRKESDARAILARVREALRPRARVEVRLAEEGEVRGRIDGISVRSLLEIVCATRPSARVSIRDASFNYEVEIRDGAPQRATRTAGDGQCLQGSHVLSAMLGVSAGRFVVVTSSLPIEAQLDGNLASQLAKPIARARAASLVLNGAGATRAARVELDASLLEDYLKAVPIEARRIATRMAEGVAPHALVLDGAFGAALVFDIANDLASRGIVKALEDENGNDVLGPEIERLTRHADARAAFAPRTPTPAPLPTRACASESTHPQCESPAPGAVAVHENEVHDSDGSLEDALLSELSSMSPKPARLELVDEESPTAADANELAPRSNAPKGDFDADQHTPPRDQIVALSELTVLENVRYDALVTGDARSPEQGPIPLEPIKRVELDETSEPVSLRESRASKTSLTAVTTSEAALRLPVKRTPWPALAVVAAAGAVAWAATHFTSEPKESPRHVETSIPAGAKGWPAAATAQETDEITYSNVPSETDVSTGQGLLEVSAPNDSAIVVDGVERGRGGTTLPLWAGPHEVRVRSADRDRARAADVHAGRVAHIKF